MTPKAWLVYWLVMSCVALFGFVQGVTSHDLGVTACFAFGFGVALPMIVLNGLNVLAEKLPQ